MPDLGVLGWVALAVAALVVGMLAGIAFLAVSDDHLVRIVIAGILLLVIAITLLRRHMRRVVEGEGPHRVAAGVYGTLGGTSSRRGSR